MTVAELESRLEAVENKLARLERKMANADVMAGIERGIADADAGKMAPAREVLEQLRVKHNIQRT